ncbi:MAG: hypothetical protein AAF573_08380 [Bacteroidota bacterium]
MKNILKNTLLLILTFGWMINAHGQTWSSANINQSTYRNGNVGIGVTNPQAKLQISRTQDGTVVISDPDNPNQEIPTSSTPHLRFNTFVQEGGVTVGSSVWDIDAPGSLNFNYVTDPNEPISPAMSLSQSGGLTVHGNSLTVGNTNIKMSTGAGTSIAGAEAYHIGFGVNHAIGGNVGTYFNFGGQGKGGAVIQGDANGNLLFFSKDNSGGSSIGAYSNENFVKMIIGPDGKVKIGATDSPDFSDSNFDYKLYVNGGILSKEIKVRTDWADYVLEKDYQLLSLREVEAHIQKEGHLHNTPSAKEIQENGMNVGETTTNQQEKIEELFLHLIQMEKRIIELEKENKELKKIINQ